MMVLLIFGSDSVVSEVLDSFSISTGAFSKRSFASFTFSFLELVATDRYEPTDFRA